MGFSIIDLYRFWSLKLSPRVGPFDTPINLDGDRHNNHVDNLVGVLGGLLSSTTSSFRHPYENPIMHQIVDLKTGEVSENSFECAKRYGLLEQDLVLSILNRTYVWPTYQEFGDSRRIGEMIWPKL